MFFGCSRDLEVGSDFLGGSAGTGSTVCELTRCDGKIYACGDCVDNDGDHLADGQDPECLGACDDTEDSFYGGMVGNSDAACKLDCYFDGDNGSGNDDCHWADFCDPLSVAPEYPPSGDAQCGYSPTTGLPGTNLGCDELRLAQSTTCQSTCLPLTPPGCDCFGCCEMPIGSGRLVWLGSTLGGLGTCDSQSLADPERCRPCTQVPSCLR